MTQKKITKKKEELHTGWGEVASWYDELLEDKKGTYQSDLILPNLLRRFRDIGGKQVLDVACGQGYFTRALVGAGATVVGVDIGEELIKLAKEKHTKGATYIVSEAHKLSMFSPNSFDAALCVLALQNIKEAQETLGEVARVLKRGGTFYLVLNHPAFRIAGKSSWGFDEKSGVQYRRLDTYMSESQSKIAMHPGESNTPVTISFHRPLQFYIKAFEKAGLVLTHLEEWTSHKKSQKGPRQKAEDTARKEIPLFMLLEVQKQ